MKKAVFWVVDIVLTDVSEERIASIFRVEEKRYAIRSSETSVNIISTRRHIPEDCFLHDSLKFPLSCGSIFKYYFQEYKKKLFEVTK